MINQSSYGNDNDLIRQPEKKQGKMIFAQEQGEAPLQASSPPRATAMVGDLYDPSTKEQQQAYAEYAKNFMQSPNANRPNQRYSLEQTRFLNRIKNASKRMNDMYKMQVGQVKEVEKQRYAKQLEQRELQNLGANTDAYSMENYQTRQPLGKVVTQVEMNNAEARSQLREMLEYQIREKNLLREEESSKREKIYHHSNMMKDQQQLQQEMLQ